MRIDRRLLRWASAERVALALATLLGFFAGVAVVLQARYTSEAVNQVFLLGGGLAEVQPAIRGLLVAICLRAALVYGSDRAASLGALRITARLRQRLFDHILKLGPAYTRREQAGELVNTCLRGVDSLEAYYSQYLPQLAIAVIVPVSYLVLIFPLDTLTGLVLLLTAPLIPVFMVLIGSLGETLTEKQWHTLSRLSAYFFDVLQGLTTLKTLGRSKAQVGVLRQIDERYRQITMSVLRVTFLSALALEMVATLSTAIVAVEIGLRLLYGRLEFETALFLLLLAPEFYLPLRNLGARFHAGMAGVSAAGRIFAILDEPLPVTMEDAALPADEDARLRVVLDDVSYAYPYRSCRGTPGEEQGDRPGALQGVSLELQAGKIVALIGPSGAGKSTLASLLLGFITPDAGQILINGRSMAAVSLHDWREKIAWVPQHPYIFNDTVLANIRLARPSATHEEVLEAARQAHAHEFISSLPHGYDTLIGERGTRLSGGEAQRIALARAFLKDAPLLILDEATSSLDPELESQLQESISELMQRRTTLVIAHRLSTVYQAEKIYVLDKGCIVGSGSHASLMAQDGMYRKMVLAYTGDEGITAVDSAGLPTAASPGQESTLSSIMNRPSLIRQPENFKMLATSSQAGLSRESSINILRRLISLVDAYKKQMLLSVLLGVLTVASGIGLMAASAYIISAAALGVSIAVLQVPIVGVRAFGISRGLFRYLERYVSHRTTFLILSRFRTWFYQSLEPLAPARLESYRSGDLLNRAIGDVASLENFFVRGLAPPLAALIVTCASALLMYSYSPRLGINVLFFLLLAGVGVPLLMVLGSRRLGARLVPACGALSAALADGVLGVADLLVFGQAGGQNRLVEEYNRQTTNLENVLAHLGSIQSGLMSFLAGLGMWVTLILAIPLVEVGELGGVYLAVVTLIALTSFEAVLPLPQAVLHLEGDLAAARRLFEIVDAPPQVVDPAEPLPLPEKAEIQVHSLSFRYPGQDMAIGASQTDEQVRRQLPALQDLSLALRPGMKVAIVGPSGAGKSTLVKLLLRFWDVQEGVIYFGEQDIRLFQAQDVRRRLAVVEQNPYLFNSTIRENLLIANPTVSDNELWLAASQARMDEFIRAQPLGFDTLVGEGGLRLSGGERQRLAIARALLRQSPLLILDEPTANLDALVERQIMDTVMQVMQEKTTLLITHRLVGLEAMDEILVLDRGRVVERGSHQALLEAAGLYRRMWEAQNQILA